MTATEGIVVLLGRVLFAVSSSDLGSRTSGSTKG
jgi:hypothetical protein